MSAKTLLPLAFTALLAAPPLLAQGQTGIERAPKRPIDIEREAERVRTRDQARERHPLPPLTSRPLRKAVEAVPVTTEPAANLEITARWGEFLTADGEYFVPLQLSVPASLGFTAGEKAVAFGALYGADGKEVISFELDRVLNPSGTRLFTDLPLPIEPGEYRAVVGLAAGKEPRALTTVLVTPVAIAKDELTVSRLLLAENLFALPTAQAPDEPFAFGGIKAVLRGDSRFARNEQPWLFVVLRQLGLNAEGRPKLAVKLEIEGPEGADSKLSTVPVADPTPMPLKGFEGQRGLGLPLDLSRYAPGRYEVRAVIEDQNRGQSRTTSGFFEVMPPL